MEKLTLALSPEEEALRQKNYELVKTFLAIGGPERNIGRRPLLAEDGEAVMAFTRSGVPHATRLPEWSEKAVKGFPNWSYPEFHIYVTQYPDRFWAEVLSRGAFGDGEIKDGNMFAYLECRDGKISLYKEIYNPIDEAPTVGDEQKRRGEA